MCNAPHPLFINLSIQNHTGKLLNRSNQKIKTGAADPETEPHGYPIIFPPRYAPALNIGIRNPIQEGKFLNNKQKEIKVIVSWIYF